MATIFREKLASPSLLTSLALWGGTFIIYMLTLAPTLTWGYMNFGVDGPELLTAAHSMGVPHPPGYPTYTLLLKVFAILVPVGDYAHRGNLMSAVLAACSVTFLYWAIFKLLVWLKPEGKQSHIVFSSGLAASAFAVAPLFWAHAVMTEVYTLNTFFVGALLVIAVNACCTWRANEASRWYAFPLFAFLFGLGMGNHLTLLAVAVPLIIWMVMILGWRKLLSVWSVFAFALGLCIYVYLPVSASHNPPVNWGDATTASGFGWILTARVYQDYVFGVPVQFFTSRVVHWIDIVYRQINPLGIFLALVGAATLISIEIRLVFISATMVILLSIYSLTYNSVDFIVLTIPIFMIFSFWMGVGCYAVLSSVVFKSDEITYLKDGHVLGGIRPYCAIILMVIGFGAIPITSIILNYSSQDLSNDRAAYEQSLAIIDSLPNGALVLSTEEENAFALWYGRYVLHPERNVIPIAVPLLQFEWYWSDLQLRYPDQIPSHTTTDILEAVEIIVSHNLDASAEGGQVYFTYRDSFLAEHFDLIEEHGLYRAYPKLIH